MLINEGKTGPKILTRIFGFSKILGFYSGFLESLDFFFGFLGFFFDGFEDFWIFTRIFCGFLHFFM